MPSRSTGVKNGDWKLCRSRLGVGDWEKGRRAIGGDGIRSEVDTFPLTIWGRPRRQDYPLANREPRRLSQWRPAVTKVLGFEVDAINSVQFSNHTGYKVWKGQILNEHELGEVNSSNIDEGPNSNMSASVYQIPVPDPFYLKSTLEWKSWKDRFIRFRHASGMIKEEEDQPLNENDLRVQQEPNELANNSSSSPRRESIPPVHPTPSEVGIEVPQLDDLTDGLSQNGLDNYTHLLTGYVGSPSFLKRIAQLVEHMRKINPKLIYVCDPVMGDNGHMYVPQELLPIYRDTILPLADIITPNQYEVEEDNLKHLQKLLKRLSGVDWQVLCSPEL
uniref:pyridoxal kinase n=1 Tax=Timema monikensis TaxID=170555 RepID=A0A7R9HLF0_9NEOP|nr:unnamed protein product [Timema monikensis]